jgi:hypothetical protein
MVVTIPYEMSDSVKTGSNATRGMNVALNNHQEKTSVELSKEVDMPQILRKEISKNQLDLRRFIQMRLNGLGKLRHAQRTRIETQLDS